MPLTYTDSLSNAPGNVTYGRGKMTAIVLVAALHVLMFYAFTHGMNVIKVFTPDPPVVLVPTPEVPKPKEPPPQIKSPQDPVFDSQKIAADLPIQTPQLLTAPELPPDIMNSEGDRTGSGPVVDAPLSIVQRIDPAYPAAARRAGEQGTVVLSVMVDADGHVSSATVMRSSGSMELDDAALAAIKRWQFSKRNGGTAQVRVPITFKLNTVRF